MTKNSNRGLIITVIILLCIIVIMLTGFMGYVIFSGSTHINLFDFDRETRIIYDNSFDSTDISKMVISSNFGDIDIKQSSDEKIRVVANGYDEKYFNLTADAGTITITNTADERMKQSIKPRFLNPFNGVKNLGMDIDVYVPVRCLDSLEINSSFGDVEIDSLSDIDLTVTNDMGDITADSINGKFNLHTDMGEIEIKRINITADSYATTDMGDVEIEHTNDIKVSYSTSMGECKVKNSNPSSQITLTAETSMGDVKIAMGDLD